MDFGLGKYLEMFEDRFGHRATTALIVFLTLGIVAILAPLIWKNLWEPVYGGVVSLFSGRTSAYFAGITWSDFLAFFSTAMLLFGGVMLVVSSIRPLFDTKYQIEARRMERLRLRAMTGTNPRVALKRKSVIKAALVLAPLLLLAGALIYGSYSAITLRQQIVLARPVMAEDLKKSKESLKTSQDLNGQVNKLKVEVEAVARINERVESEYQTLCLSTGRRAEDCAATVRNIAHEELRGLPDALPPQPSSPRTGWNFR